jgi:hypothetical protein
MPEDPTPSEVPSTAAEDSFAEHLTSDFVKAAEKQVDILIKAATRVPKLQIRILTVVCAALLVISGVLGYLISEQYSTTQELRHDAVANCRAGNEFKAGQQDVWIYFVKTALNGKGKDAPTPKAVAFGKALLAKAAKIDAPKNCAQAYNVKASGE